MVFLESLRFVVINSIFYVLFFLILSRTLKIVHRKQSSFQTGNFVYSVFSCDVLKIADGWIVAT